VIADGTDEDDAHAAKMDEWVVWETVERAAPRDQFAYLPLYFLLISCFFIYGTNTSSLGHSAL
jgi:hypothetical protein